MAAVDIYVREGSKDQGRPPTQPSPLQGEGWVGVDLPGGTPPARQISPVRTCEFSGVFYGSSTMPFRVILMP